MNINSLNILVVLQVIGHPRDSKRIAMLQQAGFIVEAVAFERDYHVGRNPDCKVELLRKITPGRYLQRILKMVTALPKMRRAVKRNHIVYASGQDVAFMALIAGWGLGKPVVLEVGDIRKLQVASGLKGCLVRTVDKYFVNACSLLIATASGFVDTYYRRWLKVSVPAMIIENKLEQSFVKEIDLEEISRDLKGRPLVDRPLRIGYFGLLRCEWSWNVLEALAIARPQGVEIVLAGYPLKPIDLHERSEKLSNVEFLGEFHSPQDLPALYGDVDLVWGCYPYPDPGDWNWRWARTNRFYESCFFQKPIITLAGSGDAGEVERYNIGLIINDQDVQKAADTLCSVKYHDLENWKENMSILPRKVYVYTTETEELKRALEVVAKDREYIKNQQR